ncbi:MAG: hypothetical protein JO340_20835 [Acidobacteriaceae bacterium]|nr:hypothetical protein [Acidobacteriaceae bacterium]
MPERWSYVVLGRGRWARRMREVLESEGRRVARIEQTRVGADELTDELRRSAAQAAWLCVTPGPHVATMIRASIAAGLHVVAEKPWLCSAATTAGLEMEARERGLRVGVHFEYCLLEEVEAWRERFHDSQGLEFGGRFTTSRLDRQGIPALENFGSHLAAIRRHAAPKSQIAELACAYEAGDERRVWIGDECIDFLRNREPLIQRFVERLEGGAEFPFGLDFGLRVTEDLTKWRDRQTAPSRRP